MSRLIWIFHSVLRRWFKELGADPKYTFLGLGQLEPGQLEIDRLRKEIPRLKAERDILEKRHLLPGDVVRVRCEASHHLASDAAVQGVQVSRSGFQL